MISKEDRMYFIDPLQPAQVRRLRADGTDLDLRIVALRYRRENYNTPERIGTIIPVTHQRVEGGELWWVDTEGDYVHGAQLADRVQGRTGVMAIVNDDLFYVGRNGGEHHLGSSMFGTIITDAKRSDGERFTASNPMTYVSQSVVKAASWANELMPAIGDNQEVVDAKVARAKQLWSQRQKKGEIYKEGMRRDWLSHLDGLRPNHDLPTPVFNIGVEGAFLTAAPERVQLTDLSPVQQERITPVTRNSVIRPSDRMQEGHVMQYTGAPICVVTGMTASDMSDLRSASQSDIRYAVFDALRVHSGHVMETNRFAILTSF